MGLRTRKHSVALPLLSGSIKRMALEVDIEYSKLLNHFFHTSPTPRSRGITIKTVDIECVE